MTSAPVIGIIGGGFTGTLTALNLLRHGPAQARIYLVEKTPGVGRGLAYGASNPNHLLNVRAANMSAFADQPDHLIQWLADRPDLGRAQGDAFITRGAYGDYLSSLLRQALAQADGAQRLVLVPDRAVELEFDDIGAHLSLAMGRRLRLDAAVLAVGNLPPQAPKTLGLGQLNQSLYAPEPWAGEALQDLDPDAPVLLLGAGLTMVDIVLDLADRGHRGPLIALSRRGVAPHRHQSVGPVGPAPDPEAPRALSGWIKDRRTRAQSVGWRAAIDEMRPMVQSLWRRADLAERRRFLRHLRPWWDAHRHRMAPPVADRIDGLRASGQLQVRAGRLLNAQADGSEARVLWRARGDPTSRLMQVGRIINCTGAGVDLSKTDDPLLRGLITQGIIRPDPLGLGVEVAADCQVIAAPGRPPRPLYAAGPITQGYSWETTAVPDIRNQVAALAATLAKSFLEMETLQPCASSGLASSALEKAT